MYCRTGDCLIGIDEEDLIGLKIKQIASLIHDYRERNLNLFVWRYDHEEEQQKETEIAVKGPLPEVAGKLANALSAVVCNLVLENALLKMYSLSTCKNVLHYLLQIFTIFI